MRLRSLLSIAIAGLLGIVAGPFAIATPAAAAPVPMIATPHHSSIEPVYYYNGRYYPYRYNGHYYSYRYNGHYYRYRYNGSYYNHRTYQNGHWRYY